MKLTVDHDKCQGHAQCEFIAPALFQVREDGLAHVLVEQVPAALERAAREAVIACPEQATSLDEH